MVNPDFATEQESSENYNRLLDYAYISDISLTSKKGAILFAVKVAELIGRKHNINFWSQAIEAKITEYAAKYTKGQVLIPVLDFEDAEEKFDPGLMEIFIAQELKKLPCNELILFNLGSEWLKNTLKPLREHSTDSLPWRSHQFFLVYCFETDSGGNRNYLTEILGGQSIDEYKLLMNKLITTHLTIENKQIKTGLDHFYKETIADFKQCPLFQNETGLVQNFEVIVTYEGKTLFEHSLGYILNTDIIREEKGVPGYKIKNSHFRLGSKIHIRDFVYAKRIFQNSFFTNRFAFLIASYFIQRHPLVEELTIVGYGMYSQLLINRVTKMLQKHSGEESIRFNYDMVSDSDNPAFIKNVSFFHHALVIVPINTTFSTTIKIENLIQKKVAEQNVVLLSPSVNLILVSHGDLNKKDHVDRLNLLLTDPKSVETDKLVKECPYRFLNWKSINQQTKTITVYTNPPLREDRRQKYFVSVASEIFLPEHCPLCFAGHQSARRNEEILLEELLLETDKTSVNPDMLLYLPENYVDSGSSANDEIFINPEAHVFGHVVYKGNHFHHFINPEPFFIKYQDKVIAWARERRQRMIAEHPDLLNSGILLISAGDRHNTYFTDFINRVIFDESAIIIHYDIASQGVENFIKFFNPHIWQAKYIFYIDDVLQTGKTFNLMNDVVIYCNQFDGHQGKNPLPIKPFDAIFTLISKNDRFTRNNIITAINDTFTDNELKYNAFYFLYVDAIESRKCHICQIQANYNRLAADSVLDSVKTYFLESAIRIQQRDISELLQVHPAEGRWAWLDYHPLIGVLGENEVPWEQPSSPLAQEVFRIFKKHPLPSKSYLMLQVHHLLNSIISNESGVRALFTQELKRQPTGAHKTHIRKLFATLLEKIKEKPFFKNWYNTSADRKILGIYDEVTEEIIIRVLSEPPFHNVRCIKEKLFHKVLYDVHELVKDYKTDAKSFNKFRKIKFLLKRSVVLGSNYALHPLVVSKIKDIYDGYVRMLRFIEPGRTNTIELIGRLLSETREMRDSREKQGRERYLMQWRSNVNYIEASHREFGYFFVSILKEMTSGSDAKVITLEKVIDQFYKHAPEKKDIRFYYFLRLIKYENTGLFRSGLEMLYHEFLKPYAANLSNYFSTDGPNINALDVAWHEALDHAMNDYRLVNFKNYLQITQLSAWRQQEPARYFQFLQIVFLYILLKQDREIKDDDGGEMLLTTIILRSFFRIAGDINVEHDGGQYVYRSIQTEGAFLVLKYQEAAHKPISYKKMLVAETTYSGDLKRSILSAPVDERSLSYVMINGLSNQAPAKRAEGEKPHFRSGKPWVVWEIYRDGDHNNGIWKSFREEVTPINSDILALNNPLIEDEHGPNIGEFTESAYMDEAVNKLTLIRLSQIRVGENGIINEGKGIITLYGEQSLPKNHHFFDEIHKLRLSFILLPLITDYIQKHYDAAQLNNLVREQKERYENLKASHGNTAVLEELVNLAKKGRRNRDKILLINVLRHLLYSGNSLALLLDSYKRWYGNSWPVPAQSLRTEKELEIKTLRLGELYENVTALFRIVRTNEIEGTLINSSPATCTVAYDDGLHAGAEIKVAWLLIEVMITEALINIKKHSYVNTFLVDFKFRKADGGPILVEITNNCSGIGIRGNSIRRMNKYKERYTHGIGLIDTIAVGMFGEAYFPNKTGQKTPQLTEHGGHLFTLTLPLGYSLL